MMGKKTKQEHLFYYINMKDMIPKNHILRLIDKYIDFSFIRKKTQHLYSHTGRPSIDPEVLIKMLLVGYLFGITSERRLCEEINMHIGYRWFVGLNLHDKVPDHSTFSKNRHERFKESGIFQDIFDEIVRRCINMGLIDGKHLSVDGTLVKANASIDSMETVVVKMNPSEYMDKIGQLNVNDRVKESDKTIDTKNKDNTKGNKNSRISKQKYGNNNIDINTGNGNNSKPDKYNTDSVTKQKGKKISNKTHRSKTDPDAKLARKSYTETKLSYLDNYLMDNKSRIILSAEANIPGKKSEVNSALSMIRKMIYKFKIKPKTIGADKGYSAASFMHRLLEMNITPHIPIPDSRKANERGIFPIEKFIWDEENNRYICPMGKILKYHGIHKLSKQVIYRASLKDCKNCKLKKFCTRDRARSLSHHLYQDEIDMVKNLSKTKGYRISIKKRKTIEALFGEAKEQMGLRVCKFRRMWNVSEQFLLTATAQNIKRMIQLIRKKPRNANMKERERKQKATLPIGSVSSSLFHLFYLKTVLIFIKDECALHNCVTT